MAEIISGKLVSSAIREKIREEIAVFKSEKGIAPGLAVVIVGENPASLVYVRNKHKACEEVGINSYEIALPVDVTQSELLK